MARAPGLPGVALYEQVDLAPAVVPTLSGAAALVRLAFAVTPCHQCSANGSHTGQTVPSHGLRREGENFRPQPSGRWVVVPTPVCWKGPDQ